MDKLNKLLDEFSYLTEEMSRCFFSKTDESHNELVKKQQEKFEEVMAEIDRRRTNEIYFD